MDPSPDPKTVADARKSAVIVSMTSDDTKADYYCGFIVARARPFERKTCTMVIAPNPLVSGDDDRFSVCFYDGRQLEASLVAEDRYFRLLATAVHKNCVEFSPSDVDIICSPAFMFAPTTPTKSMRVSTHITLPSLESYAFDDPERMVEDSDKFFLMACGEYFQTTPGGFDRLTGGLVYNMSGVGLGAVVRDCREEKKYRGMKVVAGPVYLTELVEKLLAEVPITTPEKKGGRKRKRKRGKANVRSV